MINDTPTWFSKVALEHHHGGVSGFYWRLHNADQTAAIQEDARLQKSDQPIHAEVGGFYGHSVGH